LLFEGCCASWGSASETLSVFGELRAAADKNPGAAR
jgi:hypothetical protein